MWGYEQSRLPSHWQSPETTDGESVEEGPRRAPKAPCSDHQLVALKLKR